MWGAVKNGPLTVIDLNLFMIIFFHSMREWPCVGLSDVRFVYAPPPSFVTLDPLTSVSAAGI